jgi:hypothetical protein
MARVEIRLLAEGTPVRIRGQRGRYVVIRSWWQAGREVDDLRRTDRGEGPFRTVTRDKLKPIPKRRRKDGVS